MDSNCKCYIFMHVRTTRCHFSCQPLPLSIMVLDNTEFLIGGIFHCMVGYNHIKTKLCSEIYQPTLKYCYM